MTDVRNRGLVACHAVILSELTRIPGYQILWLSDKLMIGATVTTPFMTTAADAGRFTFLGHEFSELATTERTGGSLCVHEIVQHAGGEPPLHVHHREDEAFYVLEGTMTFHVGAERFVTTAGGFVFCPRDVPHSFTVDSGTARLLQICAPGGIDRFFAEWRDRPLDVEAMTAMLAGYGVDVVGPPPGH